MTSVFDSVRNRNASGGASAKKESQNVFDAVRNRQPGAADVQQYGSNEQHLASSNARTQAEDQQRQKDLALHKATMNESRLTRTDTVKVPNDQEKGNQDQGRNIPVIGGILKGLDWVAKQTKPISDIALEYYTPGAGLSALGAAEQGAANLVSKIAPSLGKSLGGKVAKEAIVQGVVGAPTGAGQALTQTGDLNKAAEGGISGAALGGATGILGPLVGKAFNSFLNRGRTVTPEVEQKVHQLLALPEPKPRGNVNTAQTPDVIYGSGKVYNPEPLALPQGNVVNPTRLKPADNNTVLNSVMERIKPVVTERMTPPLENPNELAKWVQTHLGDSAISLNEVRKLPYEDLRQMAEMMRVRLSVADEAHKAASEMGYNLDELLNGKLPSLSQRVAKNAQERTYGVYPESLPNVKTPQFTKQVVSGAAAPVEKVGRTPNIKPLTRQDAVTNEVGAARQGLSPTEPFPQSAPKETPQVNPADETPIISKSVESFAPELFKDIGHASIYGRDVYRNLEKSLGDHAKPYLEAFDAAKKDNIDMQEYWVSRLKTEVVDKLGIQKGSKLSGLVQKFGEKQVTLDELKAQAPKDWKKVVEADKWFRTSYDHLIDIVNESRMKVYPGNPEKIVPKRSDYYRHFRELDGLEGFKNLFETPAGIDPSLAGISYQTKPKTKFAGFMQKRGLGPYKNDAVGGFLNYIPAASYSTHIDPQISNFRSLSTALENTTKDSKNLNNTILFINRFADDLAGKTNPADRFIQEGIPGGRKTMATVAWLSNRIKSNVILGNFGSTVAQLANIPNGIAFAKQHSFEGAGRALASIFKEDPAMKQSGFLKERFAHGMYSQFDTKWVSFKNPLHLRKLAEWTMETADRIGTSFVWNSAYAKGVAQKVADPISYADNSARKLIAGRGIGEVPILQKSRLVQLVMPFQLEVANLWHVMGDFVRNKDFGGIATLFLANYLLNRGMEKVRGSGVTFDPIQAMIEASGPDLTPQQRAGRVAGEVFSNMPGGQTIASAMVDNQYSRKKIFGNNDPTRFGTGIPLFRLGQSAVNAVNNRDLGEAGKAASMIVPGFGGNQIRKTIQGIDALRKGGSYNAKGELSFPIKKSLAKNAQILLFGPNATSEARDYYENNRQPLSANDTAAYQNSPNPDQVYQGVITKRYITKLQKKLTDIEKDKTLTNEQKIAKITPLVVELRKNVGG